MTIAVKKLREKRPLRIILKAVEITLQIIKGLLVMYAVLFSIAGTVALVLAWNFVMTPLNKVKSLKTVNPKETVYMAQARSGLKPGDTLVQKFIPLDSISPNLKNAVLAAEDDGFYTHPGFDIGAILAAIEYNKNHNSIKRGASTISQQLAKNLFLTGTKSFVRKYRELAYTLLMERYLGKDRILELYLNYAQWGKNIFGCEAASRVYLKKSSRNLSYTEAARLAAVLALPCRVSPNSSNSTFISNRIAVIAQNLYLHHKIDDSGFLGLTGAMPPRKDSATRDSSGQADTAESPDRSLAPVR